MNASAPSSRRGLIVSAVLIVLVALMALVIVVARLGQSPDGPPPGAAPTGRGGEGDRECQVDPPSDTIPDTAPAGVEWRGIRGVLVPISASAGPGIIEDGGLARCYAHTPHGALLAAMNIGPRSAMTDDWRTVVEEQVMPGPGRDAALDQPADTPPGARRAPGGPQFAAYKIVSYTPRRATIQLAAGMPGGRGPYRVSAANVVWADGDWKLEFTASGDAEHSQIRTDSLPAGFIIWAGV